MRSKLMWSLAGPLGVRHPFLKEKKVLVCYGAKLWFDGDSSDATSLEILHLHFEYLTSKLNALPGLAVKLSKSYLYFIYRNMENVRSWVLLPRKFCFVYKKNVGYEVFAIPNIIYWMLVSLRMFHFRVLAILFIIENELRCVRVSTSDQYRISVSIFSETVSQIGAVKITDSSSGSDYGKAYCKYVADNP